MLLFPFPRSEQKLSINTPCDTQREITIRSTFPANQRIILQGGGPIVQLNECPKIGFRLAHIRHPVVRDKCCEASCEWHELINHIHVVYSHESDTAAWLSGFVPSSEKIIRGESEDWQLRRVEIGMDDIILRYDNGETSGDAVLEGFRGQLYLDIPVPLRPNELRRTVMVEVKEDECDKRFVRIKSNLPHEIRDDKAGLWNYDYCVCVDLNLIGTTDGKIELTRRYLFSELNEQAIVNLKEHVLDRILCSGQTPTVAPNHGMIRL